VAPNLLVLLPQLRPSVDEVVATGERPTNLWPWASVG
jgi:hypothetical protein